MIKTFLSTLFFVLSVLVFNQATFAANTELSTSEVIELISGKTVFGTSSRGSKYKMFFAEDGSLVAGDGSKGTWEVKDGSVCNTWEKRGFAGCDKVYKKSSGKIFYKTPSGKKGKFRKFKAGNKL